MENYEVNDIVMMKKGHPCGTNKWEIIRIGSDVKLECVQCKRIVTLSRAKFNKSVKCKLKETI